MALRKEHSRNHNYKQPRIEEMKHYWSVQATIEEATSAQKQEDTTITPIIPSTPWQLLRSFAQTPQFIKVRGEAFNSLLLSDATEQATFDEKTRESMKRLLPAMFQYMSEHYIRLEHLVDKKSGRHPGEILNYARTVELYGEMYHGVEKIPHEYGLDGLRGISPPDFIEVESGVARPLITKVYEVTSSGIPNQEHLQKSLDGFEISLKNNGMFFHENVQFLYVVPLGVKGMLLYQLHKQGITLPERVDIVELPFTHGEMFAMGKKALFEGKSDNSIHSLDDQIATLTDVMNEAGIQRTRQSDPTLRRQIGLVRGNPYEETSFYAEGRENRSYYVRHSQQGVEDVDDSYEDPPENFS